jgi:hypothetical protein
MHLTFNEIFDRPLSWCSDQCDGARWRTKYFHSGDAPLSRGLGMNRSESEIYIDPGYLGLGVNPFRIADGVLSLRVEPASPGVQAAVMAAWPKNYLEQKPPRFTAGMLTTEKSFEQLYGYFEAKIRMPDVVGTWPAFWLLADPGTGTHNEIDVIEMLGGRPTQQHIGHNWGYVEGQKHSQGKLLTTPDLSTAFHTYGVLWTASTIAYYRDDIEVAHYPNQGLNQRMYILLNIAMDGDWNKQQGFVAAPDARASMDVEYVRAYALP